jgi:hypothetical protein
MLIERTITHDDGSRPTRIKASDDYSPYGYLDVKIDGESHRLDRQSLQALAEVAALALLTWNEEDSPC